MINADEHKKLLAQVTQLEKNSVNYFDVEKEFFLIDSDNLFQVRPRLYGYSIQRSGIYEDDNLTPEAIAGLDGRGCYVYVDVQDGKITIKQDLNGAWGIYLFRHGDYFALSNSFFRLLDHVKFKYPLTVNHDYCHHLLINELASHSYPETAINEIQLVDRSAILTIGISEKNLQIKLIDYKEHSISPDSETGIAVLDNWIEFWGDVLYGVAQHTKFIQADLSGGFDSRVSIVPLLHSGIDLNTVRINSSTDGLHTHAEDYQIASKIAAHYGFNLNQSLPAQQFLNYSLNDAWDIDLYSQNTFRNLPTVSWARKTVNKVYYLKGHAGESIRKRWHMPPKKFIANQISKTTRYPAALSDKIFNSVKNILESAYNSICNKHNIKDFDSIDIMQYLYEETRCRHHFGKEALGLYRRNNLAISPALDPELRTIKLNTPECPDYNLLIALIFTRYAPDLLTFPFDSNRSIAKETLLFAKKINERFPKYEKKNKSSVNKSFYLQPRDLQTEKILSSKQNNPGLPGNLPESCMKSAFESSGVFALFTKYFDKELYNYAANYYDNHVFGRNRPLYSVLGVARVLSDVEISQSKRPLYHDIKHFLEQDFVTINNDEFKIPSKFQDYLTARIDVKLMSTAGDFQIISLSDDKANVLKPNWFQKDGIGYQIQSYAGKLEFAVKSTVDGQIRLLLRGKHIRNPEDKSKNVPYWIDYTKLTINGQEIFDILTPTWHDKPYICAIDTKANYEIKIQVEWLPHRSDN